MSRQGRSAGAAAQPSPPGADRGKPDLVKCQSRHAPAAYGADAPSTPPHAASRCLSWCAQEWEPGTKGTYHAPSARCNRISRAPTLPLPRHEQPARSVKWLWGWFRGREAGLSLLHQACARIVCGRMSAHAWRQGIHLTARDTSFPYFSLDLWLQLALTLHGDCSTAQSDTLQPYQITTLWACKPTRQSNECCRLPTSLGRRWLRCRPAALPWLVSATESQVAPAYTQLCSLQRSSVWRDQTRGQQLALR